MNTGRFDSLGCCAPGTVHAQPVPQESSTRTSVPLLLGHLSKITAVKRGRQTSNEDEQRSEWKRRAEESGEAWITTGRAMTKKKRRKNPNKCEKTSSNEASQQTIAKKCDVNARKGRRRCVTSEETRGQHVEDARAGGLCAPRTGVKQTPSGAKARLRGARRASESGSTPTLRRLPRAFVAGARAPRGAPSRWPRRTAPLRAPGSEATPPDRRQCPARGKS